MITYSIAQIENIPAIKQLTDLMLSHTCLGVATESKIAALVGSPRTLVTLAWSDSDQTELIGFSCGILHENVFNDLLRVSDIGLFVAPDYRNSETAAVLIERLEAWAYSQGARQVWLGQSTGDNPRVIERFYRQLGYHTQGVNAVKEL